MATTDSSRLFANDLQASAPEVRIGLSRAGVTGVHKAIRLRRGPHEKLVSAQIDCFVDLEPAQKGVHMSRFPELFGAAIDDVVIREAFLVEELAEHIAGHVLARQRALRAEVKIVASYPMARETPVSGLPTQEMVSLIGIATASPRGTRRVVGVEATGINACPCAQGMVREHAAERLAEAGFEERGRRADPRARPARDAQPARSGDALRRHGTAGRQCGANGRDRRGVDELADLRAAQAAGRAARRRAGARAAAVRRGLRTAGAARRARRLSGARGRATSSTRGRSTSRRSTATTCSRSATAPSAELRAELDQGTRLERHTELSAWLAG